MRLRKLKLEDAPFMLEWMHDKSVIKYLKNDFLSKTLEDCEVFIKNSLVDQFNLHLAIVDDEDIYMGTVSLKHIERKKAEFAITIRTIAMGKGYSKYGMKEIIRIGIEELGLNTIFWYVSLDNKRAMYFYEKNGYQCVNIDDKNIKEYTKDQKEHYLWYVVSN